MSSTIHGSSISSYSYKLLSESKHSSHQKLTGHFVHERVKCEEVSVAPILKSISYELVALPFATVLLKEILQLLDLICSEHASLKP